MLCFCFALLPATEAGEGYVVCGEHSHGFDRGRRVEASAAENFGKPFECMTIRQFCKYYRIANEAFEKIFRKLYRDRRNRVALDELDDIAYYDRVKLGGLKEDYVRLQPQTFHDYMNHHEEGTAYELPWEYECDGGGDAPLTMEQYREIVELAEWEEEARVKVVNNV